MATLLDKIWDRHVVRTLGQESLLYVDRNFVHEESAQAFEEVAARGGRLLRPASNVAFCDHYAPTAHRGRGMEAVSDPDAREMIGQLERNAGSHGLAHFGLHHEHQGIMHVAGPELGLVLPGLIVTGSDSHTCTNGALGALAFGIGQSELRQVFLTQTVWRRKPRSMRIVVDGKLSTGVTAKDVILAVIAEVGSGGGLGHTLEYAGTCIARMSMEERMTVSNMSVEAGAQAGMIAPDATTFEYLERRRSFADQALWRLALEDWSGLRGDPDAVHDREARVDAAALRPMVTWGTSLDDAAPVDACVPDPALVGDSGRQARMQRALSYMGLAPGMALTDIGIDLVFVGSCSNARIEDLRAAARILQGRRVRVPAVASPGSRSVKRQAEAEGLDAIFRESGFEWRDSGCSMCVGSNGDVVPAGKRCASTSPRNFEGRQGPGARTHVMSPIMAAAAAVNGRITDVRKLLGVANG